MTNFKKYVFFNKIPDKFFKGIVSIRKLQFVLSSFVMYPNILFFCKMKG